jgi:predicted DNA-binding transcriptional regulator YafY
VATLLLMQQRGRITAAELASELEVSVATARRDLEALSAAGVPVYPQAGRGGGWQLVGGARTDLTGLTEAEAQAVFLLLGPAASTVPAARAALRKLVRALRTRSGPTRRQQRTPSWWTPPRGAKGTRSGRRTSTCCRPRWSGGAECGSAT